MEHEGCEDWVHAVLDKEGNFGSVVGGNVGRAIFEAQRRDSGE
jgi:hypothetical protein